MIGVLQSVHRARPAPSPVASGLRGPALRRRRRRPPGDRGESVGRAVAINESRSTAANRSANLASWSAGRAVNHQAGESVHERGRRLEWRGCPSIKARRASSSSAWLGGRPRPGSFSSWRISSSASPSRLVWTDALIVKGPGPPPAVERAAHAVGECRVPRAAWR